MIHSCKRCGYSTSVITSLRNHLNKINPCIITLEDISRESLLDEIPIRLYELNKITFNCKKCNRQFNSQSNRSKHQKNCNINPEINILNVITEKFDLMTQEINNLKAQLSQSDRQQLSQHIQNNTINNVNNISEPYHIDHIRNIQLMDAISDIKEAVPTFIGNIAFNPEKPENHNVKFLNKRYSEVRIDILPRLKSGDSPC